MSDEMTDAAFTLLLQAAQAPDLITGKVPTAHEIAKKLGCGVRKVQRHPSFYDSTHWKDRMEKVQPGGRKADVPR
jgi:hypothetical protein